MKDYFRFLADFRKSSGAKPGNISLIHSTAAFCTNSPVRFKTIGEKEIDYLTQLLLM